MNSNKTVMSSNKTVMSSNKTVMSSNKTVLKAQPLTKQAFAPYGDVIEIDGANHFTINAGTVERYHDLAKIEIDHSEGGRPVISFMQITTATTLPCRLTLIERHPKGSQAFIPTFDSPLVVVVASAGNLPTPQSLKAFVTNGRQGFNFRAGVWHIPLMSEVNGGVCVIVDRAGPGENCDEHTFEEDYIELMRR